MQQFNTFYLLKDLRKLSCNKNHVNHFQRFLPVIITIVIICSIFFIFILIIYYLFSLLFLYLVTLNETQLHVFLINFLIFIRFQVSLEYHGIWWLCLSVAICILRRYDTICFLKFHCRWNFFTFSWVGHYRKICENQV